jgi:AcrR family transcriptional regulator
VVDQPESLLGRRRDLMRRDIAAAAASLFADNGFSETTVEQIADRAGISVRTFYRYCQVKEDAVTAVLAEGALSFADAIAAQPRTGSLIDDVWTVFVENFERGEHGDLQLRLARTVFTTPILLGRASTDLAVKTIAAVLISAVTSALQHSVLTGAPLGDAVRTCLQIAQNGFLAIDDLGTT